MNDALLRCCALAAGGLLLAATACGNTPAAPPAQACQGRDRIAVEDLGQAPAWDRRLAARPGEVGLFVRDDLLRFDSDPGVSAFRTVARLTGTVDLGSDPLDFLLVQAGDMGPGALRTRFAEDPAAPAGRWMPPAGERLDARLHGRAVLLAERISGESFRIHRLAEGASRQGAPIEAPGRLGGVRLFPAAHAVAYLHEGAQPGANNQVIAGRVFDPETGAPGPALPLSCRRPLPIPSRWRVDIAAVEGGFLLLRDCQDGTFLSRADRQGSLLREVLVTEAIDSASSQLAVDAEGRVGVAFGSGQETRLRVYDPVDLRPLRSPLSLPAQGSLTDLAIVSDPERPGRWAMRLAHIIGAGEGTVFVARIEACGFD